MLYKLDSDRRMSAQAQGLHQDASKVVMHVQLELPGSTSKSSLLQLLPSPLKARMFQAKTRSQCDFHPPSADPHLPILTALETSA